MRGIRAKGAMVVGLVMVLVAVAVGGWMYLRSEGEGTEPIVVGSTRAPTGVDPAGAYDAGSWNLMSNLYQSLLTFVPGRETPVPDAAESCEFTDERLTTYRCTVRDDLTFSSGRPVTPEDVKFSYDRVLAMADRAAREAEDDSIPEDEKFVDTGPSPLLATLDSVQVQGRDVIFELSQPNATFPFVVAGSAGAIVDRESYEMEEPRTDGEVVGSGPYLLTDFEAGSSAELVPNPDYRGAAEVPEYPISLRYYTDSEERGTASEQLARAWENGELDVNDGRMPPEAMANLDMASQDYEVFEATGSDIRVMAFNTDEREPMSHPAARRAVASVLDREAIARHVQQDTVEALYSLVPVGFAGHSTPYFDEFGDVDTEELRQDLLDAGLELPVTFDIAYSRGSATQEEAELIEDQLEAEGLFDVTTHYQDWSTEFLPTIYGNRSYDAYIIGWQPDFPDPATFIDLLGPSDGLNTGFSNGAINELLARTQAEPDRGRAAEDFETIEALAAESSPIIPIWQSKLITLSESEITGTQNLTDSSGVWRLWELGRL